MRFVFFLPTEYCLVFLIGSRLYRYSCSEPGCDYSTDAASHLKRHRRTHQSNRLFDADYRASYWRHTVEAVNAGRVLPIHWDDFTIPLAAKLVPAEGFEAAMDFAIARSLSAGILLQLPPALEPIVLY